jgi:hypothetical protein
MPFLRAQAHPLHGHMWQEVREEVKKLTRAKTDKNEVP